MWPVSPHLLPARDAALILEQTHFFLLCWSGKRGSGWDLKLAALEGDDTEHRASTDIGQPASECNKCRLQPLFWHRPTHLQYTAAKNIHPGRALTPCLLPRRGGGNLLPREAIIAPVTESVKPLRSRWGNETLSGSFTQNEVGREIMFFFLENRQGKLFFFFFFFFWDFTLNF